MQAQPASLSTGDALIAIMVAVSVSDANMRTSELVAINRIVDHTPIFARYDVDRIAGVAQTVFSLFEEEDGIEALFGLVRDALAPELYDTAYVLACEVAAADGRLREAEAAFLANLRIELNINRLHAAAIELATRARHAVSES